ncbi:MAG: cold shock domain-containing protein, partial [Rhodobiaceae bacterium]
VHVTAIQASGFKQLVEEQRVQFEMIEGRNGRLVAGNIVLLESNQGEAAE